MSSRPDKITPYARAALALCRLPWYSQLVEQYRQEYRTARLLDVEPQAYVKDGKAVVKPRILAHCLCVLPSGPVSYDTLEQVRLNLSFESFPNSDATRIVNQHFGSFLPDGSRMMTYGCRKDVLIDGRAAKYSRYDPEKGQTVRKSYVPCFRDFVLDKLNKDLDREIAEAESRIRSEAEKVLSSPGLEARCREALVACAHKHIGSALSAFAHLGDDVLRDAVASYVAATVMEE